MSNAKDVAARLVNELHDGTAAKDWEAWAREVGHTLQRLTIVAEESDLYHNHLIGLLDVWDDGKKPYDERAYVSGSLQTFFDLVRKDLAK